MRSTSILMVALAASLGASAWAAGTAPPVGLTPHAAMSGPTAGTSTSASVSSSSSGGLSQAPVSTNQNPLPPPPPSSLNPVANGNNTVPPTPAPATAGLPTPSASSPLPSQTGLPGTVENELRPSPSLSADQVASVQASLAAGGLYRGPIDGNMSASFRAALRQYQALAAIPQTGDIDAETMARLQRSALSGSVGSNGTTTTVGNRGAAGDPFSTNTPITGGGSSTGSSTASQPFMLSSPINTSPNSGSNVTVQP